MRELTQVRDAVIGALTAAGLPAMVAFPPEEARRYDGAVVTVDVGTVQGTTLGFCNYLGQVRDETGAVRELYGKQLEAEITVDVRAVGRRVSEWLRDGGGCAAGGSSLRRAA